MTRLEGIPRGPRVAGVDEVGRGCLFGPVFAAAVFWMKLRSSAYGKRV
jgi:ribonuclease HII